MKKDLFYQQLIPKERDLDKIALQASKIPELISHLLEGTCEKNARIRFGCLNTLVLISEKNPEVIYPFFDTFVEWLNSDNNVIKLGGIKILTNLATVDDENKFDRIFDRFYAFMTDPGMTTAANVSKGSPTIAKAKPYLKERIAEQLLRVADTEYKTEECKNILIGHVISALDKILGQLENKKPVVDFVNRYRDNSWKATRTKAQQFIRRHVPEAVR